ncbi:SE1561 family protein [Mammaliicoccus sp. Dog046]|uniref:SE1561 family protein n=1 Tax=Mammaliicoccus sp. Dog046 TaxID=3034233 RepID=UPI002B25BC5A|nr:SE1561 family protein [Mammaliicoccus sp. Dog046]WQK86274.1 SE1561 family protein [Mammaliicoccus sp. Dog046]
MSQKTSLTEIKQRLTEFLDEIEAMNIEDMEVSDVDEWIALLDELEKKVQSMHE